MNPSRLKLAHLTRLALACALLGLSPLSRTPFSLAPAPAYADAPAKPIPPSVTAVIDVQRILQESLAAKSVQQQLESQRAHFQTEIEDEENDLRKTEDELNKAHDQMPAAAYADREQQLRQRFLTVERSVEARRKVLDQAFTDSMNTVRASLLDIVDKVAHAHGANLVVVKQQTLWSDPALDVTDEVLARLNQQLAHVTVTMPPEDKIDTKPDGKPDPGPTPEQKMNIQKMDIRP